MEKRIVAGAVGLAFVSEVIALPCYYRTELAQSLSECALFVPVRTGPACHDALPHPDERHGSGQSRTNATALATTAVSSSSAAGAYQTSGGAFQAGAFQGENNF